MLYDNAQLLELLASVHAATGEPLFRRRAEGRGLADARDDRPEGAFCRPLDADSEGEEGRYYVWEAAELDRLLGADAQAFRRAYDVTEAGTGRAGTSSIVCTTKGLPAESEAGLLERCRARLLRYASAGPSRAGTTRSWPTGTA